MPVVERTRFKTTVTEDGIECAIFQLDKGSWTVELYINDERIGSCGKARTEKSATQTAMSVIRKLKEWKNAT